MRFCLSALTSKKPKNRIKDAKSAQTIAIPSQCTQSVSTTKVSPTLTAISAVLVSLALLFLLADVCRAQRRRNRNRNKGKGSNCHLKDVDKCLEPLSALGKQDNPTAIIATSDGVDRLCG
jgi:hypothetical protein